MFDISSLTIQLGCLFHNGISELFAEWSWHSIDHSQSIEFAGIFDFQALHIINIYIYIYIYVYIYTV